MNPTAKFMLILGLVLLAGGGIYYAASINRDQYGLMTAGLGLVFILAAAALARRQLSALFSRRSARLGLGAGLSVLVVLALVIFVGALSARHHKRWDLSQGAKHTLAPQTLKVLAGLKSPVKAIAFFREGQAGKQEARETLDQYAYRNRLFTYRFVDPDQDPALAKRYQVRTYGAVVLVGKDKEERVKLPEEQALTNALIRLTRKGRKKVYFLSGHGERSLKGIGRNDYSSLQKAVEAQNYEVKTLLLATAQRVPADAAVVVIAGPTKPLLDKEKERLAAYLKSGGGLLIMLDPESQSVLGQWLKERGVIVGRDLVLDQASRLFGASPAWPLAVQYGNHEIVAPLEGVFCYFPLARSVRLADKLPPGVTGVELVKSSPQSWAETDTESLAQGAKFDKGRDVMGPVSLGATVKLPPAKAAAGAAQPAPGRLVVFGDADFADNTHLNQAGNRDLALNSISYLAEEGDLVSIRPKQQASQPLLLQPYQAKVVFWIPVALLPLIFLVIGLAVVIRRRRPA